MPNGATIKDVREDEETSSRTTAIDATGLRNGRNCHRLWLNKAWVGCCATVSQPFIPGMPSD
jgi:hypothetical protein